MHPLAPSARQSLRSASLRVKVRNGGHPVNSPYGGFFGEGVWVNLSNARDARLQVDWHDPSVPEKRKKEGREDWGPQYSTDNESTSHQATRFVIAF